MAVSGSFDVGCGTYSWDISYHKPEPIKTCKPTSSSYYITHDTMEDTTPVFCKWFSGVSAISSGDSVEQEYNKGTSDAVRYTAKWDDDGAPYTGGVTQSDCENQILGLLHGCNVPNPKLKDQYGQALKGANLMDFKHGKSSRLPFNIIANERLLPSGGSVTIGSLTYTITPFADRHTPAPDSDRSIAACAVWYKGGYNYFSVGGYGFASADYGKKWLKPAIEGCGWLSSWTFDYQLPPTDYYGLQVEWKATGHLPIGPQMWSCVSNAVGSVGGGPNMGSCTGQ
ncbi:MAG: hypothetical protein Q9227_005571 [Pyrenula ochraceoflavens]